MSWFSPFEYIRRKAAEAFMLGVQDGARAVLGDEQNPDPDLAELRATVAQQIKSLPETESKPKKGAK